MTLVLALVLAVGVPAAHPFQPGSACRSSHRLAQTFRVEDDVPAKKPEEKKKAPPPMTEEDLWSTPADDKSGEGKAAPAEEVVEEIPEEEIEDIEDEKDEGREGARDPSGLGGWGAEVERDSWGDEERIQDPLPEGQVLGGQGKADAGTAGAKKPVSKPAAEPGQKTGAEDPSTAKRTSNGAGLGPGDTGQGPGTPDTRDAPGAPDAQDEEELAAGKAEIKFPSGTLADLSAMWEQRRIHLDQRDFELAKSDLEKLLRLKQELHVRNMVLHANVLLRHAWRADQAEDLTRAGELARAAIELAPDLPTTYLTQASLWFSESPFKLGRVFGALVDAAEASLRNPLVSNRMLVNLVLGLMLGFGLAACLYIVVQLLRYLRLFLHDFHHLFPRGVARLQTGLLGVLVVVLPLLFRAGLVIVLLVWAFIAWIYQEPRERVVSLLVLLFLTGAPLALSWTVDRMLLPETEAGDLLAVVRGAAPEESVVRLKSRLEEQPDDVAILAALGDLYKRTGRLEESLRYLERALEQRPRSAVLHNNLGNVWFLAGEADRAIEHYAQATRARPDLAIPYFNLSRVYYSRLDLDKGKQHRSQANRLAPETISRLRKLSVTRRANDVVADLELPVAWLTSQRDGHNGRWRNVAGHMWRAWGGVGSVETFPFVGGGLVVLFGLFLLLRRKMALSNGCVRCGRPVCRRCNSELKDNTLCGQCFHAFVKKDHVDAKSRISKEIQIRQYVRRRETFARGINFVLPGVGQIIKERTLRGGLFLLAFCIVMVQVLLEGGVMRDAQALGAGVDWLKMVPILLVFAGLYAWSVLDVFRMDR